MNDDIVVNGIRVPSKSHSNNIHRNVNSNTTPPSYLTVFNTFSRKLYIHAISKNKTDVNQAAA